MSDLSMYELEDIVWDEFVQSGDRIVPHPNDQHANEYSFQGDSRKKPRREVNCVSSDCGDQCVAKHVSQGKEQRDFSTLNNRSTMLEKDSWSQTSDSVLPASCDGDSIKTVTSLASENTTMSNNCFEGSNTDSIDSEFCANDPILDDKSATVGSNSYNYTLGHISQTEDDLSFLDSDHKDKESSDLLYYGWLDMGNFEDVDRMFRSCDSTFGIEGVGNESDLGWFPPPDAIEGSEEALESDFKFLCSKSSALKYIAESHEPSKLSNAGSYINDSSMESAFVSNEDSCQSSKHDVSATLGHLSFVNGSNKSSGSKNEIMLKQQGAENRGIQYKISTINHSKNENNGMINLHKKKSKHQNQSERKIKDRYLENGVSFNYAGNVQNEDPKLPSGDTSYQVFNSLGIRQQKQNLGHDTFGYLQTDIPFTHSDYRHPLDQNAVSPTLSGIKSGINGITSLCPKGSFHASNMVPPIESSHDPSFEVTAITVGEKREKMQYRQGFQHSYSSNNKNVDFTVQDSTGDPISVQKQAHYSGKEFKNHGDVEGGSIGIPAEFGSSNVQDSSSMRSGLDEISLETTSFRQLQLVLETLDLRTKLCIRDSLYRLARSAEQRQNGSSGDDRDTNAALMAEGTNKCTGFMDIETDTNPIDRSIAHLLFHRPLESSVTHDPLSNKSRTMIHGSITSSPVMAEKLVCQEEIAAEKEIKPVDH